MCAGAAGISPSAIFALEQRVFREKFLELLIQFHGRELQQAYRLLQLRRQRQVLRKLEL